MDYKDKDKKFYEDFENNAQALISYYQVMGERKKIIRIAKTFLKVHKAKMNKYGKDYTNKTKYVQLKLLVKTAGAFMKPYPVADIVNYEGVLLNGKQTQVKKK